MASVAICMIVLPISGLSLSTSPGAVSSTRASGRRLVMASVDATHHLSSKEANRTCRRAVVLRPSHVTSRPFCVAYEPISCVPVSFGIYGMTGWPC